VVWRTMIDPEDPGAEPHHLPDVLDQVLAGLGVPSSNAVIAITERWAELIGAEVAPHVVPVSVDHGRLSVAADSPAWASHLRWAEAELLTRLAELVGPDVVTTVVVRVARR